MNEQELFVKAIEKALSNGWKVLGDENCIELCIWNITEDLDFVVREREYPDEGQATYSVNDVIYSPTFGIAVWGESPICKMCGSTEFDAGKSFDGEVTEYNPNCKKCGIEMLDEMEFSEGTTLPAYLYHQQKMLLYAAPIRYLEPYV